MDSPSAERTAVAPSAMRGPGRLSKAFARLFMKQATVVDCESVAEGFRLITLDISGYQNVRWTPGQKLQIALGSAFTARTFTPIDWDPATGRTRILGYAHGDGPGSAWIRSARIGDACDVFGPRDSLDVSRAIGPVIVFGDETSIGLAYSLQQRNPSTTMPCLLEVNSVGIVQGVLDRLVLDAADVFARTTNDAHLEAIEQRLPALAATGATFVLTGKASSIQRLRRALKSLGTPADRLMSKPYWAPGKTGLD